MSLPTYKDIIELIKKGATVDAQERIMELRAAVMELQDENFALREKTRALEESLKIKGNLTFDGTIYWLLESGQKAGPFCQRCYDTQKQLVRLQDYGSDWYCMACQQGYDKSRASR